ncbi:delta-60 repeat domain-containing protein [Pseudomonas sp. KFB-139]|uniref:Delta-60 repeat domain-containing protein n=1 Tax=Pseudomonas serbiensis TaxID=3064350 RepID=A0ABT9CTX0_9PSED|nr:delta-60 repeat domain-containing protein [Pseudomonas sp. KFB-138]MDO7928624.1 delta-60 repeat domain-containing protein [Pseudomonas sp. KFB-138]
MENGKVIIAGTYRYTPITEARPMVVRYNTDGSLDSSFGENGIFIAPPESTDGQQAQFLDVLRESNGNILGIGSTVVYPLKSLALGLDKDGSLDPAFNGGQALFTEIGTQGCQWNNTALDSRSGLNVLCGGTLGTESAAIIGRIDNRGVWDTQFGAPQGWVRISVAVGHTLNYGVAVQNDGNILVAGASIPTSGLLKGFVFRVLG